MKVTFDFSAKRILVEGSEADLLKVAKAVQEIAPALKELTIRAESPGAKPDSTDSTRANPESGRVPSMRNFVKGLALGATYDKIAALGYYAAKYENKPTFSAMDMKNWFGLCGFLHPKQKMSVVLVDARRFRNYLENRGRDQWAITTTAENLVMEMLEAKGAGSS